MKKAFIADFVEEIIFASEGAGTATGEAKIISSPMLLGNVLNLSTKSLLPCSFTTYKGVIKLKDDYYER